MYYEPAAEGVPDGNYWTIREYADNMNCTIEQVQHWVKRGLIEAYILAHAWYIPVGAMPKKRRMAYRKARV